MAKKRLNEDVPNETIIRHMKVEQGKLLAEIDELKYEIEKRDKAIAAFKKWQSRVAEYNYQYWLREGIKLMEQQPEEREFNTLFNLINHWTFFKKRFETIKRNIKQIEKARVELVKMIDLEINNINNQKNENNG